MLVYCAHQDTVTPGESVHSTLNFSRCDSHLMMWQLFGVLCTPLFLECTKHSQKMNMTTTLSKNIEACNQTFSYIYTQQEVPHHYWSCSIYHNGLHLQNMELMFCHGNWPWKNFNFNIFCWKEGSSNANVYVLWILETRHWPCLVSIMALMTAVDPLEKFV